ncbi:MAG: response regulator transcription factor [Polyangiaceae bacterium]|nr:response regulator transcription factor [Polyangiaceae bacterium]
MIHALLVDDDRDLARLLSEYMGSHEVTLTHVEDGMTALATLGSKTFDVVLLDVMLPGINGFEVCRRIRASAAADIPVVMLTARGDDADRIVGLEIGADDYVPKPFNPRELLARVRAVLRRVRPLALSSIGSSMAHAAPERLRVGPLEIDVGARTVHKHGVEVSLTSFEFRILVALARHLGRTVTREELANEVREPAQAKDKPAAYDPSVDRSLDVHVSRLRQKLEDDPKEPRLIKTVRGVGYVLASVAPEVPSNGST